MSKSQIRLLSFVIPVKNESATLRELVSGISSVVTGACKGLDFEILIVDDGSRDDTWRNIADIAALSGSHVKGIRLRRNFGKAIALEAGFRRAAGDIVFTMDGDLQDDPKEIPRFIEAINSGFDMVSGWKRKRYDPLMKTIPSRFFNKVTAKLTGLPLHDFNCGFKAYRMDVIKSVHLYGELHRFIPVLAHDYGFRVGEIEVQHHPRKHGVSKYGWERYLRGMVDLITVLATTRWLNNPGHLFGGIGVLLGFSGGGILIYLFIIWFLGLGIIGNRPLLILGVLLCITAVQIMSLGVIAEFWFIRQMPGCYHVRNRDGA